MSAKPSLIKKWDNTELWYKKDDKFLRPKAVIGMKIYTQDNGFSKTAEGRLFANLWKAAAEEYLREFSYNAECASLKFVVNLLHDNIDLKWSGWNDSMTAFVNETFEKINQMKNADLQ